MSDDDPNPVVYSYASHVRIPAVDRVEAAQHEINVAFGFPDGNCNELDEDDFMVPKPCDEREALEAAHYRLHRTTILAVHVNIRKDGSKEMVFV
jgi:hypothetical protein